jgi:hypothetical protein
MVLNFGWEYPLEFPLDWKMAIQPKRKDLAKTSWFGTVIEEIRDSAAKSNHSTLTVSANRR